MIWGKESELDCVNWSSMVLSFTINLDLAQVKYLFLVQREVLYVEQLRWRLKDRKITTSSQLLRLELGTIAFICLIFIHPKTSHPLVSGFPSGCQIATMLRTFCKRLNVSPALDLIVLAATFRVYLEYPSPWLKYLLPSKL